MFRYILIFGLLLSLVSSCKDSSRSDSASTTSIDDDLVIARHIITRILRDISVKDQLVLRFRSESILNRSDDVSGISIKPTIKGQWQWIDESTAVLEPEEPLDYSQQYIASIDMSVISPKQHASDEIIKMQFRTNPLHLSMLLDGPIMQMNGDQVDVSISGSIQATDYMDSNAVEEMLSSSMKGSSELTTIWEHSSGGRRHGFVISGVRQTDSEQVIALKWNGRGFDSEFKSEEEIEISSFEALSISDISIQSTPSKHVRVLFNQPLKEKQILKGLVSIKDVSVKLRTLINGNELLIYPEDGLNKEFALQFSGGITAFNNRKLEKSYSFDLRFQSVKPALRAPQQGVIVPSNNGLKYSFEAVNIDSVYLEIFKIYEDNVLQFLQDHSMSESWSLERVGKIMYRDRLAIRRHGNGSVRDKWQSYQLDLSTIIQQETNAIYQVRIGFGPDDVQFNCETTRAARYVAPSETTSIIRYQRDNEEYEYGQEEDPCRLAFYNPSHFLQRNVFFSNVGVIVKKGQGNQYYIASTQLDDGSPLGGAEIILFDFQQQELGRGLSSADGLAIIDSDEPAAFISVSHTSGTAYVRTLDGQALSISDFDTDGVKNTSGMKGFIYADRGVHRPGDTIFIKFMLEPATSKFPSDHPVTLSVTDARNQEIFKVTTNSHVDHIYSFAVPTEQQALTGAWRAKVKVGEFSKTKQLRIETIKPNRLRVALEKPELINYNLAAERKIEITSSWLHGAPAADLQTKVDGQWSSYDPSFSGYEDFEFLDPARKMSNAQVTFYDKNLDKKGKGIWDLKLDKKEFYPGFLKANLTTRVFETGGDFSENYDQLIVSPYESYVGVKIPTNQWGSAQVKIGDDANIKAVSVNSTGTPTANRKMSLGVYDIDWRWWYSGDRYRYRIYELNSAEHKQAFYKSEVITDNSGRANITIPTADMDYGRKLIRICDTESGHCTGTFFYASGWGSSVTEEERNSLTRLEFKSDKEKYSSGDQVSLSIPSQEGSKILISIENEEGVMFQEWLEGSEGQSSYSFTVDKSMAPNIYAHVTLVQPIKALKNDLPIRMYGVIPIHVIDQQSILTPIIETAASYIPEEKFSLEIKEKGGKPMSYTIAIVDEGLLDLTSYNTPDPHATFYAKQSLGVKTWDMYDFVNYGLGGAPDHILSVGGGDGGEASGTKKAIRFKPVVLTAGPFTLQSNGSATHEFTMPNYIGSVRAMIVARDIKSYGNADATIPVKTPLMVLPTFPRVLSPGDEVKIPITVFAMEDNIRNVNTTIIASDQIDFMQSTGSLQFDGIGEKTAYFSGVVKDRLGIAKVEVTASAGSNKASQQIELDIRNPNPVITKTQELVIQPGESWTGQYEVHGMVGTRKGVLELSTLPSINLGNRMDYLIRYPYGCIEQTTSGAFPQLFLSDISNYVDKKDIDRNVKAAIRRIGKMQIASGGFSYWPGSQNRASDWGTSYAGHFLLAARDKQYFVSSSALNKWAKYQQQTARSFSQDRSESAYIQRQELLSQAYRLYTIALYGTPELSAMNLLRQEKDLPSTASFLLAAAYAMNSKQNIAMDLIKNANTEITAYRSYSQTYGSELRDMSLIAQTMQYLDRNNEAAILLKRIIEKLNSGKWYSTQSLAHGIMAVAQVSAKGTSKSINARLKGIGNANQDIRYDQSIFTIEFNPDNVSSRNVVIENKGQAALYTTIQMSGQSSPQEVLNTKSENQNITLSVKYKNVDGSYIDVSSIPQGTDFMAEISIKNMNTKGTQLEELALTQIIPSGWEIRSGRLNNVSDVKQSAYEYRDIRDDRVFTFFDLQGTQTYNLMLNATYEGKFVLPPVQVEAMYDKSIFAVSKAQEVRVVRN
ncbi:MAG: hypothetical protein ACJA01_002916 [Saprospiraceae bacterium]|jgi:uncharacterized protein YfaS (alpha-2-macroglobulin family)